MAVSNALLPLMQKAFGEDDPRTLDTREAAARAHLERRHFVEARRLEEAGLAGRRSMLLGCRRYQRTFAGILARQSRHRAGEWSRSPIPGERDLDHAQIKSTITWRVRVANPQLCLLMLVAANGLGYVLPRMGY